MLVEIFLVGIVEICDWQMWIRFFLLILQQIEAAAQLWEFHLGPMADKIEPCDEEAEAGEGDFYLQKVILWKLQTCWQW